MADDLISTSPKTGTRDSASRRLALAAMGTGLAAATLPAFGAAQRGDDPAPLLVPRADLVNVLQFETEARKVLSPTSIAPILGSDRTVTDRITLRPRVNIPTRDLDLTVNLFVDDHFAPIIVGPVASQTRFHAEGEVATARGAGAAKAAMVVSSDSSQPLAQIARGATAPLWLQVQAGNPKIKDVLAEAEAAKTRALIVTINDGGARPDWTAIETLTRNTVLPVIVKGVTRPEEAKEAVARGAKGVVVSNWRSGDAATLPGTLLLIAPVAQAVGEQVPVLADGSFRRGSDILKALGFGARAVLIGRPAMWGLAAYGADGVQGVVELLQTDLARYMCMCGRPSIAAVNSSVVRVHAPYPASTHRG